MEESIILKTKTSQINNIFFCLIILIASTAFIYFYETISNISINLFSMFNELMNEKNIPANIMGHVLATFFILFPLILGIWKILQTYCKTYTFTDQRLLIDYGILTRRQEQIEYYRIKDKYTVESIFLRPFNLTHYFLISTDRTKPLVKVKAIKNLKQYQPKIHVAIGNMRTTGKGREIELV